MKVLVIDDEKVLVHVVCSRLRKSGHQAAAAFDAMQAIMSVQRDAPDVVLLDVGLPGGTGFDVLGRLRNSRKTALIPVVVTSATTSFAAQAKGLGASAFLPKPLDLDGLEEALAAAVDPGAKTAKRVPPVIAR